jgi:hypothetical protein
MKTHQVDTEITEEFTENNLKRNALALISYRYPSPCSFLRVLCVDLVNPFRYLWNSRRADSIPLV